MAPCPLTCESGTFCLVGSRGDAPVVDESGQCEPIPIECDADAVGLVCEASESVCFVPADGGTGCGSEAGAGGHCVYLPVTCTADADCNAGHICTTSEEQNYCFPARVNCAGDDDCDAGGRCVALPVDSRKHPPAGWEGATQACFPEGLALLFEGRVEVSDAFGGSGEAGGSSEGVPQSAKSAPIGADVANGGSNGGCSAGGTSVSSHASNSALLMALLALVRSRRHTAPYSQRRQRGLRPVLGGSVAELAGEVATIDQPDGITSGPSVVRG